MGECQCNNGKCPFRLFHNLLKALPSGKATVSWHNRELQHYEHVESEAKVNLEPEVKNK
jgi:hypothetical protein